MKFFFGNVFAVILGIFIFICLSISFLFFLGLIGLFSQTGVNNGPLSTKYGILQIKLDQPVIEHDNNYETSLFDLVTQSKTRKPMVIRNIVKAVQEAKRDKKIKGISLEISQAQLPGTASAQRIHDALIDFKTSGKFLYAYCKNTTTQTDYYLSSTADSIFVNPLGEVPLVGLGMKTLFYKNFFDKYGIKAEIFRYGKFKSFVEPYMLDKFSDENRLQVKTLLSGIWDEIASDIAINRKLSKENLNKLVNDLAGFSSEQMYRERLVDGIMYDNQYRNFLKKKLKIKKDEKIPYLSLEEMLNAQLENSKKENIGVLVASGAIVERDGNHQIEQDRFVENIQEAQSDSSIKAVVLRVNSPGGSAYASEQIWHALMELKKEKPLVVSFGDYAASGGYYIGSAGDYIFSEPTTITGSIGVFGFMLNARKFAEQQGITIDTIQTHKGALFYGPLYGLNPVYNDLMQKNIDNTYKLFVSRVMSSRKMSFSQVDSIAQGRVWSGVGAKKVKLIDELGSVDKAIAYAAKKAKLTDYGTVYLPKYEEDFLTLLLNNISQMESKTPILKSLKWIEHRLLKHLIQINGRVQVWFPFEVQLDYRPFAIPK